MSATKKPVSSKTPIVSKKPAKHPDAKKGSLFALAFTKLKANRYLSSYGTKMWNFLARRPHRSFRRTYRRDYTRSLDLPGYWAFTNYVHTVLWSNRRMLLYTAFAYAVMTVILVSFASEDLYVQVRETIDQTSGGVFTGVLGEIGKAGLLVAAGATGAFHETQSDTQGAGQVYSVFIGLLTWLTTVWLLRAVLAGRKPKMRDGLYNAGAPIVPTFLVSLVIILQILPVVLAVFGYSAAASSGLLDGGVEAMVFWSAAGLLTMLSLYWITSTLMALVIVTLPGMYPMQALRAAGDLVIGRRVRILLRLLWMALTVLMIWALVMIPIVMFDGWLKAAWASTAWLPLVPISILIMGAVTVIWTASYIYLLYRRIVEDDAEPA